MKTMYADRVYVLARAKMLAASFIAGWNRAYWKTTSSGYWANIDWHKFEVKPPPKSTVMVIR